MVRAVEGRGHYLEGVWSWAVSGNTRLQALDAGYLNIIMVQLYIIMVQLYCTLL